MGFHDRVAHLEM